MKRFSQLITAAAIICCTTAAQARDDIQDYSISEALSTEKAKELLGSDITFYFGDQKHGSVTKKFGEFGTNKKTNGVGKSDKAACQWVFLSAMISLRDRARTEGANAVVNIRSNYRNNTTSSAATFKCGSGAIMSGTALLGDVVTIK